MVHNTGMSVSQGSFLFLAFVPTIIYIVLAILAIYFVNEIIRYMHRKIEVEKERNQVLDKLLLKLGSEGEKKE